MLRTGTSKPPSVYGRDDPISRLMRPPLSETDAEREIRLAEEAEAKARSDKIDEELKAEKQKLQKSKNDVTLLLLGQAESGKSTLQKQFQLMYSPNSLESERASWRTVVYFNIARSLKHILTTLASYDDVDDGSDAISIFEYEEDSASVLNGSVNKRNKRPTAFTNTPNGASSTSVAGSSVSTPTSPILTPKSPRSMTPPVPQDAITRQIASLRLRLSPLVSAEETLGQRLSGGVTHAGIGAGEVYVRSGWQSRTIDGVNPKGRRSKRTLGSSIIDQHTGRLGTASSVVTVESDALLDDVAAMLEASKGDIKELWAHPTVVGLIEKRKLKLDEWSEFFLKEIYRIAKHDYLPTTDDILHARIQTMGIAEHTFDVNIYSRMVTWHLYDVGGARSQRHCWVPFFDSANAIIFLAPISAFDQYLEEDGRVNRIDDSLQLFTQICANPLLKKVHLVLFLNKTDLLKAKIDRGLKVSKYILSYGDRANEFESVVQYFRAHFLQVHRRNNENRRVLYTHLTSVVDTKATQSIIGNVRDSIFRGYLQSAALV